LIAIKKEGKRKVSSTAIAKVVKQGTLEGGELLRRNMTSFIESSLGQYDNYIEMPNSLLKS
jgi:hypothetical protein